MAKVIFLILLLKISIYAQIEFTSSKRYMNIDSVNYCIIELNFRNTSDSALVIYTNNWRLSHITENDQRYFGLPILPNLVNRLIVHPSSFTIEKQYFGEDSNLAILIEESIKCLKPSDEITINIVLQDPDIIQLIKDSNYEITYIYNYAYLSESIRKLLPDDSLARKECLIIPLRSINRDKVKHHTILMNGESGNKRIDNYLNSLFEKRINKL